MIDYFTGHWAYWLMVGVMIGFLAFIAWAEVQYHSITVRASTKYRMKRMMGEDRDWEIRVGRTRDLYDAFITQLLDDYEEKEKNENGKN